MNRYLIDTTSPIRQIELYKNESLEKFEISRNFCIFNVHTSCHYQLISHSGTLRPRGVSLTLSIHNFIMWYESGSMAYRRLIPIVIVVVYFKTNSKYFVVICYQHKWHSLKEFQISNLKIELILLFNLQLLALQVDLNDCRLLWIVVNCCWSHNA